MKVAFDTSVLVAAMVEPHPLHARALIWIESVSTRKAAGQCSWHAVAECWSVLTRLPLEPPISPAFAAVAIESLIKRVRPLEIGPSTYREAVRRCSERGLRSGALFDALHLVSAEEGHANAFVTFNPADFERLVVEASPLIVVPPDPPSVRLPEPPSRRTRQAHRRARQT
jgi:predicted nucleic acid-binding protein